MFWGHVGFSALYFTVTRRKNQKQNDFFYPHVLVTVASTLTLDVSALKQAH